MCFFNQYALCKMLLYNINNILSCWGLLHIQYMSVMPKHSLRNQYQNVWIYYIDTVWMCVYALRTGQIRCKMALLDIIFQVYITALTNPRSRLSNVNGECSKPIVWRIVSEGTLKYYFYSLVRYVIIAKHFHKWQVFRSLNDFLATSHI